MAGLPINLPIPAESTIVSYNWTDVASGLGYTSYYPFFCGTTPSLSSNILANTTTTGVLGSTAYIYETSSFNSPKNIKGVSYLTGYGTAAKTMSAKISVLRSDTVFSKGASLWAEGGADYTNNPLNTWLLAVTSSVLEKRVYSAKMTLSFISGTGSGKIIYNYSDGSTAEVLYVGSGQDMINPNPIKIVKTVGFWYNITTLGGANRVNINNKEIDEANSTPEDITNTVTLAISANSSFSIALQTQNKNIKIGDIIQLYLTAEGAVCDPIHAFKTNQTLRLDIPAKIDL